MAMYPRVSPARPSPRFRHQGVSLIELLVVVAILAILARVIMPAYDNYFDKARVKSAAEEVYALILAAKAEGPIRDRNLSLAINPDAWCIGLAATPDCDCTQPAGAGACTLDLAGEPVLRVVTGAEFPGVAITTTFPGQRTTFNRLRGNASPGGRVSVANSHATAEIRVGVSGRIRLCTPAGAPRLRPYPQC